MITGILLSLGAMLCKVSPAAAQDNVSVVNKAFLSYSEAATHVQMTGSSGATALIDPRGHVIGCAGEILPDYTGFRVGLYDPASPDPKSGDVGQPVPLTRTSVPSLGGLPLGVAPNTENSNPFSLTNGDQGTYSFLFDTSRGQLDQGRNYILLLSPPAGSSYSERRIRIVIGARDGDNVEYTAASVDGMPITTSDGRTSFSGSVLVHRAGEVGVVFAALRFDTSVCQATEVKITKTADRAIAEPGDTVIYHVTVRNLAAASANNIKVVDNLPIGFHYLAGSLRGSAGGLLVPVHIIVGGQHLTIDAGDLELPSAGILELAYAVRVSADGVRGDGRNAASVSDMVNSSPNRRAAADGPAYAYVRVTPGLLANSGTLVGRVFIDTNGDGEQRPGEAGLPNAVVVLDDGRRATTDPNGLYSLPNVHSGFHAVTLDMSSVSDYTMARSRRFIEANSSTRLFRLEPQGLAKANFAVISRGGRGLTHRSARIAMVSQTGMTASALAGYLLGGLGGPATAPRATSEIATQSVSALGIGGTAGSDGETTIGDAGDSPPPASAAGSMGAGEQPSPRAPTLKSHEVRILNPRTGGVLDDRSTAVVVEFNVGDEVKLTVNGRAVDPLQIGRTETDADAGLILQTWYGIVCEGGDNVIAAQSTGSDGVTGPLASVTIKVRGAPSRITLHTDAKSAPADGRSTLMILGRLEDQDGNRSNWDSLVTLSATGGEFVGTDADPDMDGFQVMARNGIFNVPLKTGLNAGIYTVRAIAPGLSAEMRVEFTTAMRPGLMAGLLDVRLGAHSSDYFRSFQSLLNPNAHSIGAQFAGFATGKLGKWLFTGAYNTQHAINPTTAGREGRTTTDQDAQMQTFGVLGDSSSSTWMAQSQDKLYLRLEQDRNHLMWGDYNTEAFAGPSQELTATNRRLHAFEGQYNLKRLQLAAFHGDNVQGFQRDTIAPDGTSGYYFLSRRPLVPGTEIVAIEVEPLEDPGNIVDRRVLVRNEEYVIDYDRGSLLFQRAQLRTDVDHDGQLLVRRIVVTYEYENQGGNAGITGGRLRYSLDSAEGHESWVGATYVHEDRGSRSFHLTGADLRYSINKDLRFTGELARSSNLAETGLIETGSAYRMELDGQVAPQTHGRLYWNSIEPGFSNSATVSFIPGQLRRGFELDRQMGTTTLLRIRTEDDQTRGIAPRPLLALSDLINPGSAAVPGSAIDNRMLLFSVGVQKKLGAASVSADVVHRERSDRVVPFNLSGNSTLLSTKLLAPINSRVSFHATNDTSLSGRADAVYSDRTAFGVDWSVGRAVKLSMNEQYFTKGQLAGKAMTSLDASSDYKWDSNTSVTSRFSILGGMNRLTTQEAVGLDHKWVVRRGLRLGVTYEQIDGDLFQNRSSGAQFVQPYAVGQSSASLGVGSARSEGVGVEYTERPDFKASARYENRQSGHGNNTVITASAAGKLTSSVTALLQYNRASSANQGLAGLGDASILRFGAAIRNPKSDRWNALFRYESRKNPSMNPTSLLSVISSTSSDEIAASEILFSPSPTWEFYAQNALRRSRSSLSAGYSSTSTVMLHQLRATRRLNYNLDLTAEARWISQPGAGYREFGYVAEGGYYLTSDTRLALGWDFGRVDDPDFTGSHGRGGFYVGLTSKLSQFFDGFDLRKSLFNNKAHFPAPRTARPILARREPLQQSLKRAEALLPGLIVGGDAQYQAGFDPASAASIAGRRASIPFLGAVTVSYSPERPGWAIPRIGWGAASYFPDVPSRRLLNRIGAPAASYASNIRSRGAALSGANCRKDPETVPVVRRGAVV